MGMICTMGMLKSSFITYLRAVRSWFAASENLEAVSDCYMCLNQ